MVLKKAGASVPESVLGEIDSSSSSSVSSSSVDLPAENNLLRPRYLAEMIGRKREKKVVKMLIDSILQQRKKGTSKACLDHIVFYGPPGLGKTTFAYVIAQELGVNLKITSGPAIEKQGDLVALLTNLQSGDILFIDEIHRLRKNIEEVLYPAMEDRKIDIIVGQGPSAQSIRLNLAPFTLLAATTRLGLLSAPLRDRFGVLQHLDFYEAVDLQQIVLRLAKRDGVVISQEAALKIGERSRGTARIAVRFYKRVKDFVLANHGVLSEEITLEEVLQTSELLGIDKYGLDHLARKIIKLIVDRFAGGPVGLSTLAAALSEEEDTISDVYESYLMQAGFIKRTNRGRVVTEKGYAYFVANSKKNKD